MGRVAESELGGWTGFADCELTSRCRTFGIAWGRYTGGAGGGCRFGADGLVLSRRVPGCRRVFDDDGFLPAFFMPMAPQACVESARKTELLIVMCRGADTIRGWADMSMN